jgi:hypothetical protein
MPQTEGTKLYNEIMRGEEGNLLGIVLRNRVKSTALAPVAARGDLSSPGQSALSGQRKTAPKPSAR